MKLTSNQQFQQWLVTLRKLVQVSSSCHQHQKSALQLPSRRGFLHQQSNKRLTSENSNNEDNVRCQGKLHLLVQNKLELEAQQTKRDCLNYIIHNMGQAILEINLI